MNYSDIIQQSASIFSERDLEYGSVNEGMERACLIYNTITGEQMTPYQANMFLHSLKLSRIRKNARKADNYLDGINYLAFAGEAAQIQDETPMPVRVPQAVSMNAADEMEQEIKELAAKFAPVQQTEGEQQ